MTAIKEYPMDLSDLRKRSCGELSAPNALFKPQAPQRKVSIMAHEGSKDRENLPSDRTSRFSLSDPVRRKSILHNSMANDIPGWERPQIEGRFKKNSSASSIYSKKAMSTTGSQHSDYIENSWWYACCAKCHQDDSDLPSWEPPYWQKFCPYPICPTYRSFSESLSIFLIGILVWVTVWVTFGKTMAPGGQLFTLVMLTLISYFCGWLLMKITTLPALVGMLLAGILLKNVGFINFDEEYMTINGYIRKVALTIILTRAGLDLDPKVIKKQFLTVIRLALVPYFFECILLALLTHFILGLPWSWAFLLSCIMAAVAPAVVVPCLFRLREKGYGVAKGIPTLVLAVASADDACSVAVFGVISAIMFSSSSLTLNLIQGIASIFVGLAFGALCGYIVKYVPEQNNAFAVPLRVLLLLTGSLFSMLGSEEIGWGGAGPLAVIAFAFFACKNWCEQGWDLEDNPVATAFEIFWIIFEPMLFGLTGTQVVFSELQPHLFLVGGGIIVLCLILRVLVTWAVGARSSLNNKEKFFVGLSWMAKASVQAALGPVALDKIRQISGPEGPSEDLQFYAHTVSTVCILSIIITAPLGAILISLTGSRLLNKTSKPPVLEGWRRSHRPSMRQITIVDEEDLAERGAEADEETETTDAPYTITAVVTQPQRS